MSENTTKHNPAEDKELDDLLDSALQDFEKMPKADANSSDIEVAEPVGEQIWADLPENMKELEERMASLFSGASETGEGPSMDQLTLGFQKMAEAAMMTIQGEADNVADPKIVESITGAIKGLQEGGDNLQSPVDQDMISGMFSGLSEGGDEARNPFLPFMQGMMRSLLSAEVLLPSLKELLEKYPKWLEENGDKIETSEKERYIKQQKLFEVICADLESEKPEDSEDVKNERFKKVLENMQMLNEYGQPPADLVGEAGAPSLPNLDDLSMADPSQCCVM